MPIGAEGEAVARGRLAVPDGEGLGVRPALDGEGGRRADDGHHAVAVPPALAPGVAAVVGARAVESRADLARGDDAAPEYGSFKGLKLGREKRERHLVSTSCEAVLPPSVWLVISQP